MSSIMSQAVQHIIDANAPMLFTYAHSRPEFQRIVYPIGIVGDVVHTIDAETGNFKKFKLDGIVFPKPSNEKILSYAFEQELTISFNYRKSHFELKRVGIPVKFSKNGKAVLLRIEEYFPYKRWANQKPNSVHYKFFTISSMENLTIEQQYSNLPERTTPEQSFNFPDWIMNTDWSHGLNDEEPFNIDLIELGENSRGDGPLSDDDKDAVETSTDCETTDEEYLPSEDDDECTGCKYNIYNQKAHYGGCIQDEDY